MSLSSLNNTLALSSRRILKGSSSSSRSTYQFCVLSDAQSQNSELCCRSVNRHKSSIPFLPHSSNTTQEEIYERASHNAATFDKRYNLEKKDTLFSSWRTRQLKLTKQRPIKPHSKLPTRLIPPSPTYPPSFFPPYAHSGRVGASHLPPDHVLLHDNESSDRMKIAANLARRLLDYICHPSIARAGRTTDEINMLLHNATLKHGAYPSPLNYMSFPKSVCSSVNEVVCHGIPDSRPLELGDVVSFDVSCYVGGVHGDNCATIVVGDYNNIDDDGGDTTEKWLDENQFTWDDYETSLMKEGEHTATATTSQPLLQTMSRTDWPSAVNDFPQKSTFNTPEEEERIVTARRLVQAALESRDEGVAACKPGGCLSDIGGAIHAVVDAYG